ncbi:SDR family oxidoreductase [Cryptosporangium phraense]|uniref:SDR family oxidoreductase n=1 Tax=Cryptosporangium phraense TaxID=2593070 RepID=A0A545AHA5_9ACTN|nr:SDR family oxidoreductase [Cryptosporangium phraense]TQS40699.1 SDR family oxidoreductase [Cryptosporangium phraense]
MSNPRPVAVVTGASSGIGAASARRLAAEGFQVVLGARRRDRLDELAKELDGVAVTLDVTDEASVTAFAEAVEALPGPLKVLVNNAGGARGQEPIEVTDPADWQWMYEVNVIGTLRVTKALLPALKAADDAIVVLMSSTAGHGVYEGGAGYTGAKHAINAFSETLRLELNGLPIRVTEIAPGMVKTDEFSVTRFKGDQARADKVYEGVAEPLTADDIADIVGWTVTRPKHVDIDLVVVRPVAQASNYKVSRKA